MLNIQQKGPSALMTLIEVAKFLGIDYFHARTILLNDSNIGYYEYGKKRLWKREEIAAFKEQHFVQPGKTKENSNAW